jgi:hypothetical protein
MLLMDTRSLTENSSDFLYAMYGTQLTSADWPITAKQNANDMCFYQNNTRETECDLPKVQNRNLPLPNPTLCYYITALAEMLPYR